MRPTYIYPHAKLEHRVRKSNGVYKINGNKSDPSVVRVLSSMEKSIQFVITEGGKEGREESLVTVSSITHVSQSINGDDR